MLYNCSASGALAFAGLAAVLRATDGSLLSSANGSFDAISRDGTLAASAGVDGSLAVIDLDTGVRVTIQTDTALPLHSVSFGPTSDVLVVGDQGGDAHLIRCDVCAPDDELAVRARARLSRLARFTALPPPVAATG